MVINDRGIMKFMTIMTYVDNFVDYVDYRRKSRKINEQNDTRYRSVLHVTTCRMKYAL